jgi:glucokinase
MVIAAFDIGGSHISSGCFDLVSLRPLQEAGAVPANDANALGVLLDLAKRARSLYGSSLRGLSLSVPGPFDYTRGVSQMRHKLVSLYGLDLRHLLSAATKVPEPDLAFVNDADAFLLGSLFALKIAGGRSVGITLGTGIGSAFAEGCQVLSGGRGVPPGGEIWNLPYGEGMVEDTISTRRLEGDYAARTGIRLAVKSIAEAAHAGDLAALEVFQEFGKELGEVLERIAGTFNPDRVLLGGGISSAETLFLPAVLANRWCANRVSVVKRRDIAPLVGAAVGWRLRPIAEFPECGEQTFAATAGFGGEIPAP